MKGIYKRAPCLEKTGPEFSFPSGSWKKAGRNSDFRRLLLQFRRLPGKNIPRIFIAFQFLKKSPQEFGLPAASLKKPDRFLEKTWPEFPSPSSSWKKAGRNLQFRRLPSKKTNGIYKGGEFLARKRQEIPIPRHSLKKPGRNFHFFPVPGKPLTGNWNSLGFFAEFAGIANSFDI